jgi:hypothetical protein
MSHVLEVTYGMQHGKHRLYHHVDVPLSSLTYQHVGRVTSKLALSVKTTVREYHHLLLELLYRRLKGSIMDVGSSTIACTHKTLFVEHQPHLSTYYPASVAQTLLAYLPLRTSLSVRVDQLNTVSVSHSQQSRLGQEALGPLPVSSEQPEKASTFRQVGEQVEVVTLDPAVERPVTHSFDGKQQSRCYYFRGVQSSLSVLGYLSQLIVYSAEQLCDTILSRHMVPPCAGVSSTTASENPMFLLN